MTEDRFSRIRERWATARWRWCDGPASVELVQALQYLNDPEMTGKIAALPTDIRAALMTIKQDTAALLRLIDQAADDVEVLLREQGDAKST